MANVAKRSGKKPRAQRPSGARRRNASYRKPKRKVDRKLQSAQSLNQTSRLSGGPGSAGPWPMPMPMNPYAAAFGGMSMARLKQQESMRPKTENQAITQRQREVERIQNNHTIHLHLLGGGGEADQHLTSLLTHLTNLPGCGGGDQHGQRLRVLHRARRPGPPAA